MMTLSETLSMTTPVSSLRRKARRLGMDDTWDFINLAVSRGCRHYANARRACPTVPARDLDNAELVTLLLLGENSYEPTAIRCAAQLARSPDISPSRLVRLAKMEKTGRVLSHIARAGLVHDHVGRSFWQEILEGLGSPPFREEPELPHSSRFVSAPGLQRGGPVPPEWLTPRQ